MLHCACRKKRCLIAKRAAADQRLGPHSPSEAAVLPLHPPVAAAAAQAALGRADPLPRGRRGPSDSWPRNQSGDKSKRSPCVAGARPANRTRPSGCGGASLHERSVAHASPQIAHDTRTVGQSGGSDLPSSVGAARPHAELAPLHVVSGGSGGLARERARVRSAQPRRTVSTGGRACRGTAQRAVRVGLYT